jgi:hypothetical protein
MRVLGPDHPDAFEGRSDLTVHGDRILEDSEARGRRLLMNRPIDEQDR